MASTTPLLFATDLDGTLLDDATYTFDAAREALAAIAARRFPLVLVSSKTQREMEAIADALDSDGALIVENGGALVLPGPGRSAGRWSAAAGAFELALGVDRRVLVGHLAAMARATGAAIRGFSSCSADEIAQLTGLTPAQARAAADRRYDEPFLFDDAGALPRLEEAAAALGLRITRGGRFLHLTGPADKGIALRVLLDQWRSEGRTYSTVGLGDAPNDEPLLRAVERPILVPRPGGMVDPLLAERLPGAELAPAPGPAGWNAAVLTVLGGGRLPRVSGGPG